MTMVSVLLGGTEYPLQRTNERKEKGMNTTRMLLLAFCAALIFCGCSTWRKLNDTERGAVIGTGSGAVVGGAVSDSPGGALVGGAIGGVGGGLIGNEMDKRDRDRDRY